jgi:hypothetical protein
VTSTLSTGARPGANPWGQSDAAFGLLYQKKECVFTLVSETYIKFKITGRRLLPTCGYREGKLSFYPSKIV